MVISIFFEKEITKYGKIVHVNYYLNYFVLETKRKN